ncbi:arginine decarboxylase [Neisseria sp. HSC-16F19]|nr:aminotransferase class I/II-fold pyridoxal phosphate-dependent enzyme [Neisseria sp. HSC-16F19]MCP2040470.1 arginine decarboxylase [Neisseria sp. HSC-16F19]
MSALCSVMVLSKDGNSNLKDQMQVASPMMLVFDNVRFEEWEYGLNDARTQAVLLDGARLSQKQLQSIHAAYVSGSWRAEVPLYLWNAGGGKHAACPQARLIDSPSRDAAAVVAVIVADLQAKARTPFYSALKNYVDKKSDSWHTPGHSSGDSLRQSTWGSDFYHFVGQSMWQADLSVSVQSLDSLLHPEGVIAEAQNLAADAFGARRTYFATNGSSTANKVILQSLLIPGDTLLLDRNCHKSVHHGVILSGAKPVYLDSSVNEALGLFGLVPQKTILEAIEAHPHAKALILTSSTYDGMCYDLKPVIEAAHRHGIKVIIDEAWYGFARFHPALRPTALELGADYVTQSTHKTMSAFSQASMVHVNDPAHDPHMLRETFNMHASTSPQYSIIASLDVARQQMVMEGYGLLSNALELAAMLRQQINALHHFKVLDLDDLMPESIRGDNVRLDPTKITIDTRASGFSGNQIQHILFERFNIQVEKSTFATVSTLITIGTSAEKTMRLIHALATLDKEKPKRSIRLRAPSLKVPHFTELACLPRDAFYCHGERLPLVKNGKLNPALVGRVCCDQIVPYPPGIPVLVPGQLISREIGDFLAKMLCGQDDKEIHGLTHNDGGGIRVLTAAEQQSLQKAS